MPAITAPSTVDRTAGAVERWRRHLRHLRDAWWRRRARQAQAAWCGALIAITGSCGKTTAKRLIEHLLAATGASVVGSRGGNYGRHAMKTMAGLRRPTDFVVQEVAGHRPGAIARFTATLPVDIAVVTVIGYDHNRAYGVGYATAPEAIAAEKGRLVEALPPTGIACLNADDPHVAAMATRTTARVVTYGRAAGAQLRAHNVEARWPARLGFDLAVGARVHRVATRFVGTIMLPSILAALAVLHALGHDLAPAIAALATIDPEPLHMSLVNGASGRFYLLDTYKAPFWSTALLASDLANIGGRGTLFVLGDMTDLRDSATVDYGAVMQRAADNADAVILTGAAIAAAPLAQLQQRDNVTVAADLPALARLVAALPQRLVILKSDDSLRLERLVALVEGAAPAAPR